ncbi:MAG: hypothetical protein P8Z75_13535 [Gammaproteobacteria bacterium]|jgi:hypothetical protein
MNRLRTVELYRDEQRRLVAIEAMAFNSYKFSCGGQVHASITPLLLVVCRPHGNEVITLTTDGDELEKLKQQHPELDALIGGMAYQAS